MLAAFVENGWMLSSRVGPQQSCVTEASPSVVAVRAVILPALARDLSINCDLSTNDTISAESLKTCRLCAF